MDGDFEDDLKAFWNKDYKNCDLNSQNVRILGDYMDKVKINKCKIILGVCIMLNFSGGLHGDNLNKKSDTHLQQAQKAYNNKDYKKAFNLFQKSCDNKNGGGCFGVGVLYSKGMGVEQDDIKALEYYKKACELGDGNACIVLANMYYYEQGGVAKDIKKANELYKKAATLYEKSCEIGDIRACHILAAMYENGKGVQEDAKQAIKFYEKSCDLGNADDCFKIALMYEEAKGIEKDLKKANEFYIKALEGYKKACEFGDNEACKAYQVLNSILNSAK